MHLAAESGFSSSLRGRGRDLIELVGAVVLGTAVAMIGLRVIEAVAWPAYNTSNVTRALTTLGQAIFVLVAVVAAVTARYRPSTRTRCGCSPGSWRLIRPAQSSTGRSRSISGRPWTAAAPAGSARP